MGVVFFLRQEILLCSCGDQTVTFQIANGTLWVFPTLSWLEFLVGLTKSDVLDTWGLEAQGEQQEGAQLLVPSLGLGAFLVENTG